MNTLKLRRIASGLGVTVLLGALGGCVVLPFGDDGGEHRSEHGERGGRGARDHLYPAPRFQPSRDAGDSGDIERVRLPLEAERAARLRNFYRSAVYLPPPVRTKAAGLVG